MLQSELTYKEWCKAQEARHKQQTLHGSINMEYSELRNL